MPDLLLELRSEEIPARMQRKAAGDLRKLITDGLVDAGLTYEAAREYWTPRRLTLDIRGLTARSKDVREEIKGPSTKAPEQAIQGFLRKAGLSDVSQAHVHSDPKKGDFYVAHLVKQGRSAEEIIAELVPQVIRNFPWPKSMRWGKASAKPGAMRWVRPLQSILCLYGPETEETVVIDFEVEGIRAGNTTVGHRFMSGSEPITVRRFDDYVEKLTKAFVVLDPERRKEMILSDARNLAFASGLELVEDEGLLEEVSGLVEWPVVLMGEFEEEFLAIPPEVIRLTIRANQKCFVTRPSTRPSGAAQDEGGGAMGASGAAQAKDASAMPASGAAQDEGSGAMGASGVAQDEGRARADGGKPSPHPEEARSAVSKGEEQALSNKFILVSNIAAKDGGKEIAFGNGKVVRARLSDALYFWHTDQANLPDLNTLVPSAETFGLDLTKPLDQRMARLDALNVTFHAKLGTQGARVERIRALASSIATLIGADPELAARAAVLAKADLQTEVVGEFPELQGAMGRKYAVLQGEHASVAAACEEHYKPQGPSDFVPKDKVSIAVALADKLDTLVGFWAIDEKPTGSKDPYALRRAALGVIRLILENDLRLALLDIIQLAMIPLAKSLLDRFAEDLKIARFTDELAFDRATAHLSTTEKIALLLVKPQQDVAVPYNFVEASADLLAFIHDRFKVYLKDEGARYDAIDAVLTPSTDNLLLAARRLEALIVFIDSEDGQNLIAGTKRAANILAAEEKKGTAIATDVDPALFTEEEERALYAAITSSRADAEAAIAEEDFSGAMRALAALRGPVDTFFDKVLVNDENEKVRANRLALLTNIREATGEVADFSKLAG